MPSASKFVSLFQDDEVRDADVQESLGQAQAGDPSADDDSAEPVRIVGWKLDRHEMLDDVHCNSEDETLGQMALESELICHQQRNYEMRS